MDNIKHLTDKHVTNENNLNRIKGNKIFFKENGKTVDLGECGDYNIYNNNKYEIMFVNGPFPKIILKIPKSKINTLYYYDNNSIENNIFSIKEKSDSNNITNLDDLNKGDKIFFKENGKTVDLGEYDHYKISHNNNNKYEITFVNGPFPKIILEIPKSKINTLYYCNNNNSNRVVDSSITPLHI
jgi:hypothetical protein